MQLRPWRSAPQRGQTRPCLGAGGWASPPATSSSASGRVSGKRATLSGSPPAHTQPSTPAERGRRGWGKGGSGAGGDGSASGDESTRGAGTGEEGQEITPAGDGAEGRTFCALLGGEGRIYTEYKLLELEAGLSLPSDSGTKASSRSSSEPLTVNAREWRRLPEEESGDAAGNSRWMMQIVVVFHA